METNRVSKLEHQDTSMCQRLVKLPKHSNNDFIFEAMSSLITKVFNDCKRQNSSGHSVIFEWWSTIHSRCFNFPIDCGMFERAGSTSNSHDCKGVAIKIWRVSTLNCEKKGLSFLSKETIRRYMSRPYGTISIVTFSNFNLTNSNLPRIHFPTMSRIWSLNYALNFAIVKLLNSSLKLRKDI